MNDPVDIVLTSWNRFMFTKLAVKAIHYNTKYPHRLIVVDNGSDQRMQGCLYEMKYNGWIDELILLDKNYGLEYAKHLGMNFVESPRFVSTDNDILAYKLDPDWLTRLMQLMDEYSEYAAIACRPQILVGTGNIFEGKTDALIEFSHVPGYLRLMRTDFVNEVGAWKDKRPLRGHEEYWISQKLQQMGMKVGWAANVPCWHLFGAENDWGYTGMQPEAHGHTPISSLPHDDWDIIEKHVGEFVKYGYDGDEKR